MNSSLIAVALLLCFIEFASAIKCYNCTSASVEGCGTTFGLSEEDKQKYLINCDLYVDKDAKAVGCHKLVTFQITNRKETPLVVRSCFMDRSTKGYKPTHCWDLSQTETCYCVGDKCNGQTTIIPTVLLILAASVISLVTKAFH